MATPNQTPICWPCEGGCLVGGSFVRGWMKLFPHGVGVSWFLSDCAELVIRFFIRMFIFPFSICRCFRNFIRRHISGDMAVGSWRHFVFVLCGRHGGGDFGFLLFRSDLEVRFVYDCRELNSASDGAVGFWFGVLDPELRLSEEDAIVIGHVHMHVCILSFGVPKTERKVSTHIDRPIREKNRGMFNRVSQIRARTNHT